MTDVSGVTYRPWTWRPPVEGGYIGRRRVRRKDGYEKTSGKAVYTRDVHRPGMLHAKPLTSPYAHARIKSMDTTNAMALPGVRDIIRYDEEGTNVTVWGRFGGTHETLPGEAHMWGDPVGAIVIADSEQICDQALRLIEIDWEELPFSLDWDEALEPGAPLLRPDLNPENNIKMQRTTEYGNLDEGFQEADQVIEFTVTSERDVWAGVEGHCNVAEWRDEYLNIWHGGQQPSIIQNDLATSHASRNNVDLCSCYVGARFGGLSWTPFDRVVPQWAAMVAKRVGKPVKMWFDGSHFYGAEDRVGTYEFKIGFMDDGTITALDLNCIYNAQTLHDQISKIREHSKIENMRCVDTTPFNNYGYVVCYKHGAPATLISSMVYNRVADALGMEPPDIALINEGASGHSIEHVNEEIKVPLGFENPHSNSMEDCINACKQAIDWDNVYHAPGTKILPNGKYHGIGCIFTIQWGQGGMAQTEGCGLKYNGDGSLGLIGRHGDGGWNSETTYCQVIADEAGFKYEDVTHRPFEALYDLSGGGGSFGTTINITTLVPTARAMKQLVCEAATQPASAGFGPPLPALFPDKTPEELDIKDSVIFEKANPDNQKPVSSLAAKLFAHEPGQAIQYPPGITSEVMARQAHFEEIEVDPETGQVEVKRIVMAQDVGQVLNPDSCEGQSYGGAIMGVGRAYIERELFDPPSGVNLNDNICSYAVPTILDYGTDPEVHFVENHLGWTVYGCYGVGESAAAVGANLSGPAVHNAIGKWIDDYPITPDKILKALGKI